MQFKLTFKLTEPLTLPLSYHSALQGMIYHVLSASPEFSAFLHDDGYARNRRAYKLFVFGTLEGPYRVRDGRITFPGPLSLEVRSPAADFRRVFAGAIAQSGAVTIGERRLNVECEIRDFHIDADSVGVRMRSPLCLTRTIDDGAKKRPCSSRRRTGAFAFCCAKFRAQALRCLWNKSKRSERLRVRENARSDAGGIEVFSVIRRFPPVLCAVAKYNFSLACATKERKVSDKQTPHLCACPSVHYRLHCSLPDSAQETV